MLNPQELELLNGLLNGAQNASLYSYEVAVRGTAMDGAASLACNALSLVITLIAVKYLWQWLWKEGENDGDFAIIAIFIGIIGSFFAYAIIASIVWSTLHDPMLAILAPEYVVINKILAAAAQVAH